MKKYFYVTLLTLSSLLIFGFSQIDDSNSYVDLNDLNPLMDRVQLNGLIDDTTRMACCKICSKGKACGDSCISKSYTCHKPPGCACNG